MAVVVTVEVVTEVATAVLVTVVEVGVIPAAARGAESKKSFGDRNELGGVLKLRYFNIFERHGARLQPGSRCITLRIMIKWSADFKHLDDRSSERPWQLLNPSQSKALITIASILAIDLQIPLLSANNAKTRNSCP